MGMGRKKSHGTGAHRVAPLRRRSGLFKSASELTTLCAVETVLVFFSPCGEAVSFAHRGVETVSRFTTNLAPTGTPDSGSTQLAQEDHEATLQALDKKYHDLLELLEAEKKRGERLQKRQMMNHQHYGRRLWETPVDELNIEELLTLYAILEDLVAKLKKHMVERSAQTSAPTEGNSVDHNGNGTGTGN